MHYRLFGPPLQVSPEIKRMNEESRSNLVERIQNLRTATDHQEMIRVVKEKRNQLDTMMQQSSTEDERQEFLESNWDHSITELPEEEPLTVEAITTVILPQIQQLFTIVQECRIDLEEQIRSKDETARTIDRDIASCQESINQVDGGDTFIGRSSSRNLYQNHLLRMRTSCEI